MFSFSFSWAFYFKVTGPDRSVFTNKESRFDQWLLLYIIMKEVVCFLDQYSMMKYDFLFIISNINH